MASHSSQARSQIHARTPRSARRNPVRKSARTAPLKPAGNPLAAAHAALAVGPPTLERPSLSGIPQSIVVGDQFDRRRLRRYTKFVASSRFDHLTPQPGESVAAYVGRCVASLTAGFESVRGELEIEPILNLVTDYFEPDEDDDRLSVSFWMEQRDIVNAVPLQNTDPRLCAALLSAIRHAAYFTYDTWTAQAAFEMLEQGDWQGGPSEWWDNIAYEIKQPSKKKRKKPSVAAMRAYVRKHELRSPGFYIRNLGRAHYDAYRRKTTAVEMVARARGNPALTRLVNRCVPAIEKLRTCSEALQKQLRSDIDGNLTQRYGMNRPAVIFETSGKELVRELLEDYWQEQAQTFVDFSPNLSYALGGRGDDAERIVRTLEHYACATAAMNAILAAFASFNKACEEQHER